MPRSAHQRGQLRGARDDTPTTPVVRARARPGAQAGPAPAADAAGLLGDPATPPHTPWPFPHGP